MKPIFADAFYWAALLNPQDDWHSRVQSFSRSLTNIELVTTEEVLVEVLTFYAVHGTFMRQKVGRFIRGVLSDPTIQVIPQSHNSFMSGLMLYEQRLDKGYSLQDCTSMQIMKQLGVTEVLTHDKHFAQEGFVILF